MWAFEKHSVVKTLVSFFVFCAKYTNRDLQMTTAAVAVAASLNAEFSKAGYH